VVQGPSWEQLIEQAATLLNFQDPELLKARGTGLQILEYFKLKNDGDPAQLTYWLHTNLSAPDDDVRASDVHAALASLDRVRLIYTTNYDELIERSLRLHGRRCATVALESHIGRVASPEVCEVVKFHGDLRWPNTMVLSESDYERRLALSTVLDYRLRGDLLGRVVLFLGYSFRDWNVSYLFRLVNEQFRDVQGAPVGPRAYIAVPEPSDFEVELFRARNIEVIAIGSADPAGDMAGLLRELAGGV
jgi:hypothetical protein